MDYGRLRAEYDAAFDRLRRAERDLRSIRLRLSPDRHAEEIARQRFDDAEAAYRKCRMSLADSLLAHRSTARPTLSVATHGCRDEVRLLAYRLWEEDGRPAGNAEEHWYRAEEILRSGAQLAA